MKVSWLHNAGSREIGRFMWDVFDRVSPVWPSIEQESVPVIRKPADVAAYWRAARTKWASVDLVHAQYGSAVGLAARMTGKPYVVSFRGSDLYPHPGGLGQRLAGRLRLLFSWFAARGARANIVMSEAMRARLRNWPGLRRSAIHVLVDPCGAEFWPSAERRLGDNLREKPLIVMVASLAPGNPIKRIEIVRDAVRLCGLAGMNISLVEMIGKSREDVANALSQCDVLALPSTHEGWPNIVKECLILGKTYVATAVSDLPAHAAAHPENQISRPHPVDFAFAFVDKLVTKLSDTAREDVTLAAFHPDACALKHVILYTAYGDGR